MLKRSDWFDSKVTSTPLRARTRSMNCVKVDGRSWFSDTSERRSYSVSRMLPIMLLTSPRRSLSATSTEAPRAAFAMERSSSKPRNANDEPMSSWMSRAIRLRSSSAVAMRKRLNRRALSMAIPKGSVRPCRTSTSWGLKWAGSSDSSAMIPMTEPRARSAA